MLLLACARARAREQAQHDLSNVSAPELMVVFVASDTQTRECHERINDLMESLTRSHESLLLHN
jgi:hypothetical protein